MAYTIERAKPEDARDFAHIQTESWKAAFREILSPDVLAASTALDRTTTMYERLIAQQIGNGYLLRVDGLPHCIAWWDATRANDMPGYAELICIHSLQDRWRQGYGSKMIAQVLADMAAAGYQRAMLWVFRENHTTARRFYEKHDFRPNGREKIGLGTVELCYEKALT